MQGPSQPGSFSDLSRVLAPEKPGHRRKGGRKERKEERKEFLSSVFQVGKD